MRITFLTMILVVAGAYVGCVAGKNLNAQQVLRISLSRHMVEAGNSLYVTCRTQTHDNNRWIEAGIEDFTVSTKPMEGRYAPRIWPFLFKGIPCGSEVAYCKMYQRNDSGPGFKEFVAIQRFVMTGCEGE